jgi:transposase
MASYNRNRTNLATRSFIVALISPRGGKTTAEVAEITGLPKRTINSIYARAIARGFDPNRQPLEIRDDMLQDNPRSGRPKKQTDEVKEAVISIARRETDGSRERGAAGIAGELGQEGYQISAATVRRILEKAGFNRTKPTRKKGLARRPRQESLR